MASSVSVKVNWILSCDWLPEQARSLGFPVVFYKSVSVLLTYIKSSIDQAWSVKMTDIGLVLCLHTCLWNLTLSWSVRMQKNLADIQPSWPHTLPKTPMYYSEITFTLGKSLEYAISLGVWPSLENILESAWWSNRMRTTLPWPRLAAHDKAWQKGFPKKITSNMWKYSSIFLSVKW